MTDHESHQHAPYTCLSTSKHDHRVSNVVLHYFGCLPRSRRRAFFESLPHASRARIRREEHRIAQLRAKLEVLPQSTAGSKLRDFKSSIREWRDMTGRPTEGAWQQPPSTAYFEIGDGVEADIRAPVVFFKNGRPYTDQRVDGTRPFPNQKVSIKDLLTDDPERNPLMQECDDDMVRYFHLPANNMIWVEEAIARYYGEKRPNSSDLFLNAKLRRQRTRTEMLLRQEFWHGQQNMEAECEVHARHMRGMCDLVSIDQEATEIRPKNLVMFMPYLHWDTDRSRLNAANKIKEVGADRFSLAEVLNKAQHRLSRATSSAELAPIPSRRKDHLDEVPETRSRRNILGTVLRSAAALLDAMDFYVEEQLLSEYLHAKPPLHPRRTLDQSYYGALKSTGTRDRDQVVYRATAPEAHEHDPNWESCQQCKEDARKVSRLIMVDQLWLWILDDRTVLSSFPRKWGKSKPDPSAVHKGVRHRLEYARKDEISSAYDLALIIIDEASRVFFDRTKTNDRQPNMVDMFADAIRGVTYKQTAAFDQFLIYTDLASREYKRQRNADASTQNHLLNINSEGGLLKEVKDIMDEIHIICRIKEQQGVVMESFVKHLQRSLPTGFKQPPASSWEAGEKTRLTLDRAERILQDIQDRICELKTLSQNAANTSSALKDLLTLKQQQAGVIEAREAATTAAETLKQGQSIMIFTIVTIIFLPLSFCATFFGMNSVEFNDGRLSLTEELIYMFPVSGSIIIVSFLLAFSRSSLSNSFTRYIHNSFSLVYNTAATWILVKTGLYMLGRSAAVKANKLKDRENKITGMMKANVMREKNNLEKMRAASTMRKVATTRVEGGGSPRAWTPGPSPRNPASPFIGVRQTGLEDVELGQRRPGSSQVYLVPER